MNAEALHDAIGLLPADLIAEADKKRSRKPRVIHWKHWAAMAACLALIVCCGLLFRAQFLPGYDTALKTTMTTMDAAAAPAAPQSAEDISGDAAEAATSPATGASATNSSTSRESAVEEEKSAAYDTAPAEALASFSAPPALEVVCKDNTITIQAGSYTWSQEMDDGTTQEVIACGAHPLDNIDRLPVMEAAETAVALKWEVPPAHVTAQCWSNTESEAESVSIEGSTLFLKPGTYVCEVSAEWTNGSGSYAFLVSTPEP